MLQWTHLTNLHFDWEENKANNSINLAETESGTIFKENYKSYILSIQMLHDTTKRVM